ncbi:MAG: tyrosine-type recombinase/integrase [Pseudonocardiaceae bacterium]
MTRAATKKLAPGEDSIDRVHPIEQADGSFRLQWTIVLRDGRIKRPSSFGPTVAEARRRARRKAAELLKTGAGDWKLSTRLTEYVDHVTRPALKKADLRPLTRDSYDAALGMLLGKCAKCSDQGRSHEFGLNAYAIGAGIRRAPLENLLTEVAERHGLGKARHCRTVLNEYLIRYLVRDELVAANPLAGMRLTSVTGKKKVRRTRGGRAIDRKQYEKFLSWLLSLDPADMIVMNGQAWTKEVRIQKVRNAIDMTLLQMTTGLRQTEARRLAWALVQVNDQGVMSLDIPEDVAKTGDARVVLILDQRVAGRFLDRRRETKAIGYVIGAPSDPSKMWARSNCGAAVRQLYELAAKELSIDVMLAERSHMWRTTLRSFYEGRVPPAVLNAQFGHSEQVAQKHYTDVHDLRGLAAAAKLPKP